YPVACDALPLMAHPHRSAGIEERMLCDRCQSKEASVHISTVLHGGPTLNEDHLCPECAQTSLATNPLLNQRTDPLPAVGAQQVMPKTLLRLLDRMRRHHPDRFAWQPALKRVWRRWTGR